jgi:ABC-type phosphate transport system ATPase subunit
MTTISIICTERRLIEFGDSKQIFITQKEKRTESYITGRFG